MRAWYFLSFVSLSHALFSKHHRFRQIARREPRGPYPSPQGKKRYIIDIDGTICTKTNSDYPNSKPIFDNIDVFNMLYEKGHEVHYWTARGANSGLNWDEFTVKQLNEWNVRYDSINMGKPHYDVWIDDKAFNAQYFCDENS